MSGMRPEMYEQSQISNHDDNEEDYGSYGSNQEDSEVNYLE